MCRKRGFVCIISRPIGKDPTCPQDTIANVHLRTDLSMHGQQPRLSHDPLPGNSHEISVSLPFAVGRRIAMNT